MGIVAHVVSWPHADEQGDTVYDDLLWGDYTPQGIQELEEAERAGATVNAVDEQGNKTPVSATSVSDPAPEPTETIWGMPNRA